MEVGEHHIVKRWCPVCRAWQQPEMKWAERVVGQGRIGVRPATVVAYLHQSLRTSARVIQAHLATIHQARLSVGGISGLLQRLHDEHQADGQRLAWVLAVQRQYQLAQEAARLAAPEEHRQYDALWQRTQLLGLQYAQVKGDPVRRWRSVCCAMRLI